MRTHARTRTHACVRVVHTHTMHTCTHTHTRAHARAHTHTHTHTNITCQTDMGDILPPIHPVRFIPKLSLQGDSSGCNRIPKVMSYNCELKSKQVESPDEADVVEVATIRA